MNTVRAIKYICPFIALILLTGCAGFEAPPAEYTEEAGGIFSDTSSITSASENSPAELPEGMLSVSDPKMIRSDDCGDFTVFITSKNEQPKQVEYIVTEAYTDDYPKAKVETLYAFVSDNADNADNDEAPLLKTAQIYMNENAGTRFDYLNEKPASITLGEDTDALIFSHADNMSDVNGEPCGFVRNRVFFSESGVMYAFDLDGYMALDTGAIEEAVASGSADLAGGLPYDNGSSDAPAPNEQKPL